MNPFQKTAFIDEFGTNSFEFEKENVSSHFIISCILVDKTEIEVIQNEIEKIRQKHFQTGEIKSSGVAENDRRRIQILVELAKINFQTIALIIDKRRLEGEGFGYKPSFYKFLHGLLYKDLYQVFSQIDVIMDEHGNEKYMHGFIEYIRKKHPPDLFSSLNKITFQNSKENVLVQLADFMAGTFARIYDETKKSPLGNNFLQVIRKRIGSLSFFPRNYDGFIHEYDPEDKQIEPEIAELSLRIANEFIDQNEKKDDPVIQLQVRTIKLLRLYRQTVNIYRYISTKEILTNLNYGNNEPINSYYFRTNVIAKLRDKGLIISSSKNGYKLPVSKSDLYDFINHNSTVITPMLSRLKKCQGIIKLSTGIDLLEKEEYKNLKTILELKE